MSVIVHSFAPYRLNCMYAHEVSILVCLMLKMMRLNLKYMMNCLAIGLTEQKEFEEYNNRNKKTIKRRKLKD